MTMNPVQGSSNIAAEGYDADSRTFTVEFHGGRTYSYADVGPEVYAQFKAADSKGAFFAAHIKNAFRSEKLP